MIATTGIVSHEGQRDPVMFELRDLECFLAIVEHKTFHRAAKACGIAQPPLSRRIASLERELGGPLFSHESRRTELTEMGTMFAREARIVLEQARMAQRRAADFSHGVTGHVRVGYVGSSGYALVPAAIGSFRASYPRATISVEAILGHRQIEALRIGTVDIALSRGPIDSTGLYVRRLRSDRFLVAITTRHPLADREKIDAKDLAREPFVALTAAASGGTADMVRMICANAGFLPHIVQEVDTYGILVTCVAMGLGVALVSESVRNLPVRGVTYRELHPKSPSADLNALARAEDQNPLVPVFIDHLAAAAKTVY